MDELKQEKKDTEGRVNTLKRKFREIKSTCSTLAAEPTDKELASILPELRKEVGDMDAQIEVTLFFNLPSTILLTHTPKQQAYKAKGEVVDPSKKEKMVKKMMKYVQVWKKRRRNARDVIDKMADGFEKKPKMIIKMMDLETDVRFISLYISLISLTRSPFYRPISTWM